MSGATTADRRAYWTHLLRASTAGLTPEQFEAATDLCLKTELDGNPCGTWHAAASVAKRACWCSRCRPDIKRYC